MSDSTGSSPEPKTPTDTDRMPGNYGGWLKVGNPGNAGGGVPTKRLRELCREGFSKGVGKVSKIAEGTVEGDSIRALDVLGKYGLGESKAVLPEEMIDTVAGVLSKHVDEETYRAIVSDLIEALKE